MLNQPFFQVALPIMLTFLIAVWVNNKAFDATNRRLDDIVARLGRIEDRLLALERKVNDLELKAWR